MPARTTNPPLSHRPPTAARKRGFSLLVVTLGLSVMIGMVGLAVDLGRAFVVRSELQAFADAAAVAACRQMDGTRTGIEAAHATATAGPLGATQPNRWNFGTLPVVAVTDTYADSFNGAYQTFATARSNATNSWRFVRITASGSLPVYFLAVIPGIPTSQTLQVSAVAGQRSEAANFSDGGLVPVSPAAHDATDTKNFGLTPNVQYSLKWGNHDTTTCAGDIGFAPNDHPSSHGFIDIGQGNGTSSLDTVIVYGGYPNPNSTPDHVSAGDTLYAVPGNRGAAMFSSFAERSSQDPDQRSWTWEEYKAAGLGNGRRIVTAPVYDPAMSGGSGANAFIKVVGFANFLLDPAYSISGSSGPICAIYIGPASQNSWSSGGSDGTRVYNVKLFQ